MAQAVIYLGTAPKSNSAYKACNGAIHSAKEFGSLMPPKHILNAPTKLMSEIGYGDGYIYDHDTEHSFSGQDYFPEGLDRLKIYDPKGDGREKSIKEKIAYLEDLRARLQGRKQV